MEEFVTVQSYDGKLVRVPIEQKEEYLRNQMQIKHYLEEGKSIDEIKKLLAEI